MKPPMPHFAVLTSFGQVAERLQTQRKTAPPGFWVLGFRGFKDLGFLVFGGLGFKAEGLG